MYSIQIMNDYLKKVIFSFSIVAFWDQNRGSDLFKGMTKS